MFSTTCPNILLSKCIRKTSLVIQDLKWDLRNIVTLGLHMIVSVAAVHLSWQENIMSLCLLQAYVITSDTLNQVYDGVLVPSICYVLSSGYHFKQCSWFRQTFTYLIGGLQDSSVCPQFSFTLQIIFSKPTHFTINNFIQTLTLYLPFIMAPCFTILPPITPFAILPSLSMLINQPPYAANSPPPRFQRTTSCPPSHRLAACSTSVNALWLHGWQGGGGAQGAGGVALAGQVFNGGWSRLLFKWRDTQNIRDIGQQQYQSTSYAKNEYFVKCILGHPWYRMNSESQLNISRTIITILQCQVKFSFMVRLRILTYSNEDQTLIQQYHGRPSFSNRSPSGSEAIQRIRIEFAIILVQKAMGALTSSSTSRCRPTLEQMFATHFSYRGLSREVSLTMFSFQKHYYYADKVYALCYRGTNFTPFSNNHHLFASYAISSEALLVIPSKALKARTLFTIRLKCRGNHNKAISIKQFIIEYYSLISQMECCALVVWQMIVFPITPCQWQLFFFLIIGLLMFAWPQMFFNNIIARYSLIYLIFFPVLKLLKFKTLNLCPRAAPLNALPLFPIYPCPSLSQSLLIQARPATRPFPS